MFSPRVLLSAYVVAAAFDAVTAGPVPNPVLRNHHGAVASESAVCSRIGLQILQAGGNAADAMVATTLCVGVIGMYHSGIGGGGFALVHAPSGAFEFIDFREKAPAASTQDMYNANPNLSIFGGLASGVPGELRGLEHLHRGYGALPWAQVVAPAVKVARDGFNVTADLYQAITIATALGGDFLTRDPSFAVDFAPTGRLVRLGETMTRKRYAATLDTIGRSGADAFYSGPIADATIRAVQKAKGIMTLQDLKDYAVVRREPAQVCYRDYIITSGSAPSSGAVAMSVFNTISGYDMSQPGNIDLDTHRLDEAIRFAYGERTSLGDPSFVPNVTLFQREMLAPRTGAEIRSRISDTTTLDVAAYDPAGLQSLETPGTSSILAIDDQGLTISLTTTINLYFGSLVVVPETGVIMNNEMNDFSIPNSSNAFGYKPSPSNFIRPGKRPQSSISTTIVTTNKKGKRPGVYMVTGSAGGSRIITAVVQNLWHVLDQNMTAPNAVAAPRLHDQLIPNVVSFETGYDPKVVASMQAKGHNVTFVAPGLSTANAIRVLADGSFEPAREVRQQNSGAFAI
ncbi:MAG: hypothetical protein M1826_003533 [Phylliscum demangeonii]|nr:MAG: hypothetical protein M1826_003533 [Phylliscum demangeonii]